MTKQKPRGGENETKRRRVRGNKTRRQEQIERRTERNKERTRERDQERKREG